MGIKINNFPSFCKIAKWKMTVLVYRDEMDIQFL